MTDFIVVYIQLTASQVGAKYQKRGLMVMSESLEELKSIIDNAPEGATHIEGLSFGTICYLRRVIINGVYSYEMYSEKYEGYIGCPVLTGELRSLSDIKRIIELMGGGK